MPDLTRRHDPDRPDCWLIYHGDVYVGMIAVQPGIPFSAPQWR